MKNEKREKDGRYLYLIQAANLEFTDVGMMGQTHTG